MSFYDYGCDPCRIVWEEEYPIGKAPKTKKCPECGKRGARVFLDAPALHFKGPDFHTNVIKWRRANEKTNKQDGDEFMNNAIEMSKQAQKEAKGTDYYARYTPSKQLLKDSGMRPMDTKEKSDANKKAKELVNKERNKTK